MVTQTLRFLAILGLLGMVAPMLQAQTLAPGSALPERQAVVPEDEPLDEPLEDPTATRAPASSMITDELGTSLCEEGCDVSCLASECGGCEVYDPWTSPDVWRRGQFFVRGWLAQGFTWNPYDPNNKFNAYLTFNDRANDYLMNQLYVSMGRRVNTESCQWDWGGRVDVLYGSDYFYTTAVGLETRRDGTPRWNSDDGPRNGGHASLYGLAMPQIYAELYAPWRYGTTFKFGHFYSILGYESVMAPENFFYSHSYVRSYGEPYTHTGMLADYRVTSQTTLHAGFTRGWDTWEDPNDEMGFLGGMSWTSCDERTNLAFALHTGKEDNAGNHDRTSYSLVCSRRLTDRFTYVFQHDMGIENDGALKRSGSRFTPTVARWYGINQYFLYAMTCKTSLGFRLEWFRDEEMARLLDGTLNPYFTGGSVWSATVGLNWKPCDRFTVRPEARWDWSDTEGTVGQTHYNGLYDEFRKKNRFTFAVDAIFVF